MTLVAFSIRSVTVSVCGSQREMLRFDNSPVLQQNGIPDDKRKVEGAMIEELLELVIQFKGFV